MFRQNVCARYRSIALKLKQFAIFTQQNNKIWRHFESILLILISQIFRFVYFNFICVSAERQFVVSFSTKSIQFNSKHKFRDNACGAFFARLKISYSLIIARTFMAKCMPFSALSTGICLIPGIQVAVQSFVEHFFRKYMIRNICHYLFHSIAIIGQSYFYWTKDIWIFAKEANSAHG